MRCQAALKEGGPGSGVAHKNTKPIGMPLSDYISVGTRKGLLDNSDWEEFDVPLDMITRVAQKNYVPKKMNHMMKNRDLLFTKPIDVLWVRGDGYHVIDGHHRFLAAKRLKIDTLPARVFKKAERTMPDYIAKPEPEPESEPENEIQNTGEDDMKRLAQAAEALARGDWNKCLSKLQEYNFKPTLIKAPSGVWMFVGSVPAQLSWVNKDGSPLDDKQAKEVEHMSNPVMKFKQLTFKDKSAALKAAHEAGVHVEVGESKKAKSSKLTEDDFNPMIQLNAMLQSLLTPGAEYPPSKREELAEMLGGKVDTDGTISWKSATGMNVLLFSKDNKIAELQDHGGVWKLDKAEERLYRTMMNLGSAMESVQEAYVGFKGLVSRIKKSSSKKGHKHVNNPGAVAAAIGRKKYGKGKFQKMAAAGKHHHTASKDHPVNKMIREAYAKLKGIAEDRYPLSKRKLSDEDIKELDRLFHMLNRMSRNDPKWDETEAKIDKLLGR